MNKIYEEVNDTEGKTIKSVEKSEFYRGMQ